MFSGTIKILDIDDYIKPSQECIKPLMQATEKKGTIQIDNSKPEILLNSKKDIASLFVKDSGIKPDLIKLSKEKTAKVTLNDCLACSGCVTTAETILIQQHSTEDFLAKIKSYKCTIITISPQARASIAYYYNVNEKQIHLALLQFFEGLGSAYFFDQTLGIDLSLLEAQKEFLSRYEEQQKKPNQRILPVLCSECPGWICYAEKVTGDDIIPYISNVRSPQQIIGNIVKNMLPQCLGLRNDEIYHACIMACYDKKLEATRKEFEYKDIKDVDTVLTSSEIIEMINIIENNMDIPNETKFSYILQNIDNLKINQVYLDISNIILEYVYNKKNRPAGDNNIQNIEENKVRMEIDGDLNCIKDTKDIKDTEETKETKSAKSTKDIKSIKDTKELSLAIYDTHNPTSNSYCEAIINIFIEKYSTKDEKQHIKINYKQGKNSDIEEFSVMHHDQEILTGARIYGLKNIQNIVRNIKKGIIKYSYIEIMACPSGCLNGGGQIKPKDKDIKPKELISLLKNIIIDPHYKVLRNPESNIAAKVILDQLLSNSQKDIKLDFSASYKAIEKNTVSMSNLKW